MPSSQKTFRVFVSSTFSDMRAERKILQQDVFPRLKKLCEGKWADFQAVDLRWGVNEESQRDHKTMDICLGEIARCQKLSPKPNFIILLGQRYGWQPVPSRIPSIEMVQILPVLSRDNLEFINNWYCEDLNAVPPAYVLQPRGADYAEYKDWEVIEERLRDILRAAVDRLGFTEEQRIKYECSATHQEIIRGALNPPDYILQPRSEKRKRYKAWQAITERLSDILHGAVDRLGFAQEQHKKYECSATHQSSINGTLNPPDYMPPSEHVFAYMRGGLPEIDDAREYVDRSKYSKDRLKELRQQLKSALPEEHRYEYKAGWNNGCEIDDLKAFAERVYIDLSRIIEPQLNESAETDDLSTEIKLHREFKEERLRHFTGQEETLRAIREYIDGNGGKIFSLIGQSGSGKTSIMAKAIEKAEKRSGIIIYRFAGRTSGSSDISGLLRQVIEHICRGYGVALKSLLREGEDEKKFLTVWGLRDILFRSLAFSTAQRPLIIFIDALDQLSADYSSFSLEWLPQKLPDNVRIVVSALSELEDKLTSTEMFYLQAMSEPDARNLLNVWLADAMRELRIDQREEVIKKYLLNGTPLYLKLAFEKARTWSSYRENAEIKPDIESILGEYFSDLQKAHDAMLVSRFCGYILCGRYQGLTETELLDLLSYKFDKEYLEHFIAKSHPDHSDEIRELGRLPVVVWSRLYLDLEPYLTRRNASGFSIISFYHRQFAEYAQRTYLQDSEQVHLKIANYFETRGTAEWSFPGMGHIVELNNIIAAQAVIDFVNKKRPAKDAILHSRVLVELPWQLMKGADYKNLIAFLGNDSYLDALWRRDKFEISEYWSVVEAKSLFRINQVYNSVIENPDKHVQIVDAVNHLLFNRGGYENEIDLMNKNLDASSNDLSTSLLALSRRANAFIEAKRYDEAYQLAIEVERTARAQSLYNVIADSLYLQAQIHFHKGLYQEALDAIERQEDLEKQYGNDNRMNLCLKWKATTLKAMNRLKEAMELYPHLQKWYEEQNDLAGLAACLYERSTMAFLYENDFDLAMRLMKNAEDVVHRIGNRNWLKMLHVVAAHMFYIVRDYAEVVRHYEEYSAICSALGDISQLKPMEASEYANALFGVGNYEKAYTISIETQPRARLEGNATVIYNLLIAESNAVNKLQPQWRSTMPFREYQEIRRRHEIDVPSEMERLENEIRIQQQQQETAEKDIIDLSERVQSKAQTWRKDTE